MWRAPFNYITSLSNDERIRLVTVITIASIVLLSSMVVALVILVLREQGRNDYVIHPGSIPLVWYSDNIGSFQVIVTNSESKKLIARVMVESTAGFQNSGIYLKKGEKVILEPDGRVHLALRQVYTFTGSVRPIIEREKAKN